MQAVTKIPSNYKFEDDSLFEFMPIKRMRKSIDEYSNTSSNYSYIFFKSFKSYNPSDSLSFKENRKNVVIKNIGNMNQKHLKNALEYILRNSEDKVAINESFELKTYREVLQDWEQDFSLSESTNEAMHLVFSLKELNSKSIIELLKNSVYETMKSNFSQYQFVLIPHVHQNNPHIHCIVNKSNIWSGKKLRFAKKSDCRDFFFKLKEDFKNELYHFSGGKIDYKNDVRLKFDSIFNEFESINEQSKHLDYRGFYAEGIKGLNVKYLKIKNSIKILESQMAKLYEEKNPQNFSEKCKITHQVEAILKKISSHNQTLQKLKQDMERLSDWDQNFNNFTKSFNLFEKKKVLYDSMVKMKSYASKTLFKHLSVLENQLSQENIYIQQGIKDIDRGFDKNIFLNEKTHIFALNKRYKQLKNYARMLKDFVSKDFSFNPNEASQRIIQREQEVLALIEVRIKRLLDIYKNLKLEIKNQKEKLDKYLNNTSQLSFVEISETVKLTSKHLRNLKSLSFVGKELLLAKKILKDTNQSSLKEINQKNQNKIAIQIKEIQQVTQNLSQQEVERSKKQR